MLTIELHGTDEAHCGALSVKDKKSPVCKLARKLIGEHDVCATVQVSRRGTPVFNPVALWRLARMTASEPVGSSVRLTEYRSNPMVQDANGR